MYVSSGILVAASLLSWFAAPFQDAAQPTSASAQSKGAEKPAFSQEELDQMLAPIALYPDALLTQVLMASTYPLEIVEADRWAKAHKDLKGDAAAKALEQEKWDPSVKSLTDFEPVLEMLSTKLDWTQKLGDAFIGQQKAVMDTVQKLRHKAKENGQLESNKDVKVETAPGDSTDIITIESTSTTIVYVPTYDPVIVYGTWWYPAYPPYPYYPPGYHPHAAAWAFTVGVAWGYAWGHCNWHHSSVNINVNQNINFNQNINRNAYAGQHNLGKGGSGAWQHDAAHRGNVPYRNTATAKQYGGVSTAQATQSRAAYRGRAEQGRGELNQGAADSYKRPSTTDRGAVTHRGADGARPSAGTGDAARGAANRGTAGGQPGAGSTPTRGANSGARPTTGSRPATGSHGGGLSGANGSGVQARAQSARGNSSRGGGGGGGRGRR